MKGSLMGVYITTRLCFALFFLFCLTWFASTDALSCDSCGRECTSACGTKYFRTCCFNYLRKRSSPSEANNLNEIDPEHPGFVIPQKILNGIIRIEQDLDTLIRPSEDGNRLSLNKKPRQLPENNMDYS